MSVPASSNGHLNFIGLRVEIHLATLWLVHAFAARVSNKITAHQGVVDPFDVISIAMILTQDEINHTGAKRRSVLESHVLEDVSLTPRVLSNHEACGHMVHLQRRNVLQEIHSSDSYGTESSERSALGSAELMGSEAHVVSQSFTIVGLDEKVIVDSRVFKVVTDSCITSCLVKPSSLRVDFQVSH